MKKFCKDLIKKLTNKRIKISVAESCTGGLLATTLTSVSGSSQVFTLGLVTYSNEAKINILKVPKKIIRLYGAVSKECCISMVKNLYKLNKSEICISITGVAGPKGGSKKKPVGLVYIGIKNKNQIKAHKFMFKNKSRNYIQKSALKESLTLIMRSIK